MKILYYAYAYKMGLDFFSKIVHVQKIFAMHRKKHGKICTYFLSNFPCTDGRCATLSNSSFMRHTH